MGQCFVDNDYYAFSIHSQHKRGILVLVYSYMAICNNKKGILK